MKKTLMLLFLLLILLPAGQAQLYIQPGASMISAGNVTITCKGTNFINKGTFQQGTGGTMVFNGSSNDTLFGTGTAPLVFENIEIATSGTVVLVQPLDINTSIRFVSGYVDLHGNVITLQPAARLAGESETSRIIDTALGGYVSITQSLNAPNAVNPGNLGAIITSAQNLGSTTVNRRHSGYVMNGSTYVPTAYRQYEITPANDNGLNATLRCQYFDGELHGLTEADLLFIKSTVAPYTSFTKEGYTSRSATGNYIEKTGINDLSLWAITSAATPLPLTLLSFSGQCEGTVTTLAWQTTNERNVSHFDVQQSADAIRWNVTGSLPVTDGVHDYAFRSQHAGDYYRLSVIDRDGSYRYSGVVKVHCDKEADDLSVYPNPAHEEASLNIYTTGTSSLKARVYAANGTLVYSADKQLTPGTQIMTLPLGNLAAGIYSVNAHWGNGQYSKTIRLVKL